MAVEGDVEGHLDLVPPRLPIEAAVEGQQLIERRETYGISYVTFGASVRNDPEFSVVADRFIDHGKREILLEDAGLTAPQIAARTIRAAGRSARVMLTEG